MDNKEIFMTVLHKAQKNGFYTKVDWEGEWEWDNNWFLQRDIRYVIFSHTFAKALWGEALWYYGFFKFVDEKRGQGWQWLSELDSKYGIRDKNVVFALKAWEYHLQQMILTKEPIKYLENYV